MSKRLLRVCTMLVTAALLMSPIVQAGTLDKGMKGDDGNILSSVSTYAGSGQLGSHNGLAEEAEFRMPAGLAVLPDGTVLVSDSRNHLIRQIDDGGVSTYAGMTFDLDARGFPQGGWHDDEAEVAMFYGPAGIAVDEAGYVYIADSLNHMIRVISPEGVVTNVAGHWEPGHLDGQGEAARFYQPLDVAVAEDGTLYVADTLNHLIRAISPQGEVMTLNAPSTRIVEVFPGVVEWAGDYADGHLSEAKFNEPSAIAIDSKGNLYVSDTGNQLIRYIDLDAETVTTVAGVVPEDGELYDSGEMFAAGGFNDGVALEARFNMPRGIAISREDGLIIADSQNHVIRYLIDGHVMTVAGKVGEHGQANGINGHNTLYLPTDVIVLTDGSFIIADQFNHVIRQFELYRLPYQLPMNDDIKVVIDDEIVVFDVKPELINGRVMVPVRAIAEALDYVVEYSTAPSPTVFITDDERRLQMTIGETSLRLEQGEQEHIVTEMDRAPFIKDGRTIVSVRFISEQLGFDVAWNQSNRTVIVRHVKGVDDVEE